MPYVLMMKFSSEAALKTYYEDHAHSDARRTLYRRLNPDMIPLYELIERHPEEIKKAIWAVINRIGKDWIERRD
jgi:transcriptional regulator with AAA-type ATPase domain